MRTRFAAIVVVCLAVAGCTRTAHQVEAAQEQPQPLQAVEAKPFSHTDQSLLDRAAREINAAYPGEKAYSYSASITRSSSADGEVAIVSGPIDAISRGVRYDFHWKVVFLLDGPSATVTLKEVFGSNGDGLFTWDWATKSWRRVEF